MVAFALSGSTALDLAEKRERAAVTLRFALAEAQNGGDEESRTRTLALGARAASEQLSDSVLGARLKQKALAALSQESAQTQDAEEPFRVVVERALADLEFVPYLEAELPAGFPPPTPVGEIERKQYPRYRMAQAPMNGERSVGAFWVLFQHIQKNDIAMTAPVETTWSENSADQREVSMAFLYASTELGQRGDQGALEVMDIEPAWAVSIGCRGYMTAEAVANARAEILSWIDNHKGLVVSGAMRTMGYNSPMVPANRRYFEVQIPVEPVSPPGEAKLVIDFSSSTEAERWMPVNDRVMGGLSSSSLQKSADGNSVFAGEVSLENNGGFASIRSSLRDGSRSKRVEADLSNAEELVLLARGDGNAYKLRLRTSDAFDGVSYEVRFETKAGEWSEHVFALKDFQPVWRGRTVPDAKELKPEDVRSVGLMISDKQAGSFRLELASLSKR